MYAPYLSGDKLLKAQMSRKTAPLFYHQLTLLSCFTLVMQVTPLTNSYHRPTNKFRQVQDVPLDHRLLILVASRTSPASSVKSGYLLWSKINPKHSCRQINPKYLSPAFELLDWRDTCRVEKHCRLRTSFSSRYFFNSSCIYV